ncbi:MAG: type IV pili methyl-accepting chemotaxis transducer N-terminal domain-containing protein [Anaerolineae bacterium]
MFASLRAKMGGLFLAFSFLVTISVALTSWIITTQHRDALVINLAGRQRMLVQQMTKEALQLEREQNDLERHGLNLREAAQTFDQTLRALSSGGQAPYLPDQPVEVPAIQNPIIRVELEQIQQNWNKFDGYLDTIAAAELGSPDYVTAIAEMERLSSALAKETDEVVRLYEVTSAAKVARLQWIQSVFFISVLGLLVVSYRVTRRSVLTPLHKLGVAAERIGDGDLDTPVEITGPDEINTLAHSFDATRIQLKASQTELTTWMAELESRIRRRTQELASAFELGQEIVTDLDLERLLSSVTDRARELTQAETASLCLLDEEETHLLLASSNGVTTLDAGWRQPVGFGMMSQVVNGCETVDVGSTCAECVFLDIHNPESCLVTPLRTGQRTLGALCVIRSTPERFGADETRVLTLLANSTAVAIANARLLEAGRRQAEQSATLAERERLAAELHDHLAQTLSFLNLKAQRLKDMLPVESGSEAQAELEKMMAALDKAYGQTRAALAGLHEVAPDAEDLAEELAASLADFQETSGIVTELIISDPSALDLPRVTQQQVLHIVSEALANARRHAQAQQVWVRVEHLAEDAQVRFTVEDDGRGFDPAEVRGNNHLGLTIMQTRAKRCGGQVIIDSAPDAGTRVIAHFPLDLN